MTRWAATLGLATLFAAAAGTPSSADETSPFSLADQLGLPAWLDLGLHHRSRVETMRNNYRPGDGDDETAYALRTQLRVRVTGNKAFAAIEVMDSRLYATAGTPLSTGSINAFDLLQAHIGMQTESLFTTGDSVTARIGRITMDLGSRRLLARNRYRNTINAFTGLDAQYKNRFGQKLRAFTAVPITRLPTQLEDLDNNTLGLDEENTDALVSGLLASSPNAGLGIESEVFGIVVLERDGDVESRNRRLLSTGFRIVRKPEPARFDFQVEAIGQFGKSRSTTSTSDVTDLGHTAFFTHAEIGYQWRTHWSPRIIGQYDFASGDRDPDDDANNRFDTLFGARRFDFGPTGIYGAFARTNVHSPGLRLTADPSADVDIMWAHRFYWLAAKRDSWSGLRDTTGASGRYIGQQVDVRVRWRVLDDNLAFDVGGAHLLRGGFAKNAPDGSSEASTLLYAQVTATL